MNTLTSLNKHNWNIYKKGPRLFQHIVKNVSTVIWNKVKYYSWFLSYFVYQIGLVLLGTI